MSAASRNLALGPGRTIVLLAEQFPSNVYPWRAAAARSGAEVLTVDASDGDLTSAVLDAIDPRTAIVALPHCRWTDGALLDLETIGERVREAGGALVLDSHPVGRCPAHRRSARTARVCGRGDLQVADGSVHVRIPLRASGPPGWRAAGTRLGDPRRIRGLRPHCRLPRRVRPRSQAFRHGRAGELSRCPHGHRGPGADT